MQEKVSDFCLVALGAIALQSIPKKGRYVMG